MSLFNKDWSWSPDGGREAIVVGRLVRPLVRNLLRKGFSRAEILYIFNTEVDSELLTIAAELKETVKVEPQAFVAADLDLSSIKV